MKREIIAQLKEWKESKNRKPLILQGARQVGKTWVLKEFGKQYFKNTYYVQFMDNAIINRLFEDDLNPDFIIKGLEMYFSTSIVPEDSLIIFDEIQESPKAIKSLKYFAEQRNEYYIAAAGSYLGFSLHNGVSFPVGKVDFLQMYPLSFREFLISTGNDSYVEALKGDMKLLSVFAPRLEFLLKQYIFIGGMPEVVQTFIDTGDYSQSRKIQLNILKGYDFDFSKYADSNTSKLMSEVWKIIPSELAKENKKFILSHVRSGLRSYQLADTLTWLTDSGLVYKVNRVKIPHLPLSVYLDRNVFKLFIVDIGLLCAASNISSSLLLDGDKAFIEFKGALAEQYVLQELKATSNLNICYYTNENSTMEIDFLLDNGKFIIPVEVKSGEKIKTKSLNSFTIKFSSSLSVILSMKNYEENKNRIYIPLWAVSELERLTSKINQAEG